MCTNNEAKIILGTSLQIQTGWQGMVPEQARKNNKVSLILQSQFVVFVENKPDFRSSQMLQVLDLYLELLTSMAFSRKIPLGFLEDWMTGILMTDIVFILPSSLGLRTNFKYYVRYRQRRVRNI